MFETQLAAVFKPNHPHHHLYCTDMHHSIMGCNDMQAIDVGLSCEQDAVGKYIYDLCKKNDANVFITTNEEIIRTGVGKIVHEMTSILYNGQPITYLSYKHPLKNEHGKTIGVMGMSVPIEQLSKNKFNLTPQQEKCFQFLLKGFNAKEIAKQMQLSHRTIEHYIADIKFKMKCKNIRELILKYANS